MVEGETVSAIAGLYYPDGRPIDQHDLDGMAHLLAHRGPDGGGLWVTGSAGLVHRMLWTTPESLQERLPASNGDGTLVITADARLDNRDELIDQLGLTDRSAAATADGALILAAYERWADQCPERLRGDFAFAIWDARRQRLFAARDHFGVRPFYYAFIPEHGFAFASEARALLALDWVPRRLNEERIAEHLIARQYSSASTFIRDIQRLPPGHRLAAARDGLRIDRYYQLDPTRETRLRSDADYAAAFRDHLSEAVRRRLRRAFPSGSLLSGGLDSSAITCLARQLTDSTSMGQWPTFSAIHDRVTTCDESRYITAILKCGGFHAHYFWPDRVSPLLDLERVLWHVDGPTVGGNLYIDWGIYCLARQDGIRILLDGFDGDSTISHGLGYLVELATAGRWGALAREVIPYARALGEPWGHVMASWLWAYGLKPRLTHASAARRAGAVLRSLQRHVSHTANHTADGEQSALLRPDFLQRTGLLEHRQSLAACPPRTEREHHYRRLTDPGLVTVLEVLDHAAAAWGIEVRFPFWDRPLVEFCLSLPAEQKIRRGWTRFVMRQALEGILPPEVQWRPGKTDHHDGFATGLLTFERQRLAEIVARPPRIIAEWIDLGELRGRFARCVSGGATPADLDSVWQVVSLALWLHSSGLAS
ncbi:MAG: lasso peptide isopeptide bond-forming cyclase [Chloroflexi bacterium]|nr:lasso peptide isopeptide bond-forming cyclase [Chloroflexota bacterium]